MEAGRRRHPLAFNPQQQVAWMLPCTYLINLQEGTTDTGPPLLTRKQRHLSFHGLLESRLLLEVDVLMRGSDGLLSLTLALL
jgi:hypothetical protein